MCRGSSVLRAFTALPTAALLALAACGSPPAPTPPPAPTASAEAASPIAPPDAAPTAALSATPAGLPTAASSAPPATATVVIHRSEIYASVVAKKGKVLETISMLMTSDTLPPVGTKALLFRKARKGETGDWIPLADVTLDKLGDGGSIQLTLGDDKVGAKGETYKKNLAIKIQIDR